MALRKVATADDIARAVLVLASDELSGHITGELVTVAGGMEGRTIHPDRTKGGATRAPPQSSSRRMIAVSPRRSPSA